MKLIARKDFRNNLQLDLDKSGEFEAHEAHVHRGQTFSIGTGKELKDLSKADQQTVASLTVAGCVVDASNKEAVAEIEAEVETEKKRLAAAEKANKSVADSSLVASLAAALKGSGKEHTAAK